MKFPTLKKAFFTALLTTTGLAAFGQTRQAIDPNALKQNEHKFKRNDTTYHTYNTTLTNGKAAEVKEVHYYKRSADSVMTSSKAVNKGPGMPDWKTFLKTETPEHRKARHEREARERAALAELKEKNVKEDKYDAIFITTQGDCPPTVVVQQTPQPIIPPDTTKPQQPPEKIKLPKKPNHPYVSIGGGPSFNFPTITPQIVPIFPSGSPSGTPGINTSIPFASNTPNTNVVPNGSGNGSGLNTLNSKTPYKIGIGGDIKFVPGRHGVLSYVGIQAGATKWIGNTDGYYLYGINAKSAEDYNDLVHVKNIQGPDWEANAQLMVGHDFGMEKQTHFRPGIWGGYGIHYSGGDNKVYYAEGQYANTPYPNLNTFDHWHQMASLNAQVAYYPKKDGRVKIVGGITARQLFEFNAAPFTKMNNPPIIALQNGATDANADRVNLRQSWMEKSVRPFISVGVDLGAKPKKVQPDMSAYSPDSYDKFAKKNAAKKLQCD